ncbi:MAG: peptidylprolyl isomerase [Caldisericaceae bacterium]|nr:peptidylprolyl isomerase [Caldisericaceae bacterium]
MQKNSWLIVFFATLLLCSCQRQKSVVVARVGQYPITLEEFRLAYLELLKKPGVFDSADLREQFLEELINRHLLANEARKTGLQHDEKLQARVEAYYEKALREAHYKAVIEPKVQLDSNEVKAVYSYTRQQRKLKHLYFKTKAAADSAYQQLKAGASWMELAGHVFKHGQLARTGGDLGWVHWDQMEYEMAMTAFGQKKGTISQPVKSTYGYHLLLVEDLKIDPFITEEDFLAHREATRKLVLAKRGAALARDYIEQKMANVKIEAKPSVMKAVGQHFKKVFQRTPSPFDNMQTFQLREVELTGLERGLWDFRNEVLVYINGQPLTVKKFLYALNFVPYRYVRQSFKTALDFVIRDQVLTAEAKAMDLEKRFPFVRLKKQILEDYLLQLALRRQLVARTRVTQQQVMDYYQEHPEQFKSVPVDSAAKYIKKLLSNKMKQKRIVDFLDSLRTGTRIERFAERIHAYYEKILSQ